jgi:hypothetical protein
MNRCLAVAACSMTLACGKGDLPGDYYDVQLEGEANTCTTDSANYSGTYEYRLEVDVQDVQLSIEDDLWAQGSADGCLVTYQSIVWEDIIDDFVVRWQIRGDARVNTGGGGGCVEDGDWAGTESFVVLSSDHPDIAAGCTYDLTVNGTWIEEI